MKLEDTKELYLQPLRSVLPMKFVGSANFDDPFWDDVFVSVVEGWGKRFVEAPFEPRQETEPEPNAKPQLKVIK